MHPILENTTYLYAGNPTLLAKDAASLAKSGYTGKAGEIALVNGIAAGGVSLTSDTINILNNPKKNTPTNWSKAIDDAAKAGVVGWFTSPMGPVAATSVNIGVDKITTGDGQVGKNVSNSVVGVTADKYIPNTIGGMGMPFIREILLKVNENINFSNEKDEMKNEKR